MSEWISVTDRLPDDGASVVMAFSNNDPECTGYYSRILNAELDGDVEVWRAYSPAGAVDVTNVTHWLLYPEPPRDPSKEGRA